LSAKSLKLLHPDSFPRRQKCVCGQGFALDPAGAAYRVPHPLAGFNGPTSKGREGQAEEGGRERGKWRERVIPALLFPHFEACYGPLVFWQILT